MRKSFFKSMLGLLVLFLLGCANLQSAVRSYDIEESFGTAAKAYKATILEEQKRAPSR